MAKKKEAHGGRTGDPTGPVGTRAEHRAEVAVAMGRDEAYTTVLKLMQIMTEKGLISRDAATRRARLLRGVQRRPHAAAAGGGPAGSVFDGPRRSCSCRRSRPAGKPDELRAIRV
jgi:hypothetical protein